ncbi:MAG: hypothetical protein ACFFCD_00855 [Promethearchaeota archaeon]
MATTLELQEKQAEINVKEEGLYRKKLFFLISLEKCNECHFIEETRIKISLSCEKCIQEALERAEFNTTIKQLDITQYKIIHRETPVNTRSKELKSDHKEKKKTYSEKLKMYEAWIIDQIISGNHKIIDAAQHGSLFSQTTRTEFVDVAFKNLEERTIIKRDNATGNYYLVDKKTKTEEKETPWNYCVKTKNANENFKTLEGALAFVKSHNLINYYIKRRETL